MFGKIGPFFKETRLELKKVSWTTRDELIDSTIVVLVSVGLLAIFIGIVDVFLSRLIRLLM